MSHSLTKIWIHLIFGTKEREPLIKESFEKKLFEHIKQIIDNDFKSLVTGINGTPDHMHILMLQNQITLSRYCKECEGKFFSLDKSKWIYKF